MDDGRYEQMLEELLRQDFSAGTETFRDELLARCLEVLDSEELGDGDLELLAAAGDPFGDDEDAASARFLGASGKGRAC